MKKFCTFEGTHGLPCMIDPDQVIAIVAVATEHPGKPASVVMVEGFIAEVIGTPEQVYQKLVEAGRLH